MKMTSRATIGAALPLLLSLTACGKTTTEYVTVTAPASTYLVEYIPGMMEATMGKTTFKLRVRTRADYMPATGLATAITLKPLMTMPTYSHAAPADVVTESTTTPGTYDCAIYYQMASGAGMGYWEVTATIGNEKAVFNPSVAMAMGSDSTLVRLWGVTDVGAGGMASTKYVIFRDGPLTAAAGSLKLYLARAENMMMDFKPVYVGATLAGPTGTVTSATLTASADAAFTTPLVASHSVNGHWSVDVSSLPLAAGTQATVYLKLNVNGENKTTDGNVLSGGNGSVAFKVTPQ
jgi:hypothetical protein